MHKCCIKGCESDKDNKGNVSYFNIPTQDKNLLKKWVSQIGQLGLDFTESEHICSRHFKVEDMEAHANFKQRSILKPQTVPAVLSSNDVFKAPAPVAMSVETHLKLPGYTSILKPNSPVIVIPAQYSKLEDEKNLIQCPSSARLRKILPKPGLFSIPIESPRIHETQPMQQADLFAIPDILVRPESVNLNGSPAAIPSRYPGQKRPLLRITISKERKGLDDKDESITIKNSKTQKLVTFKLDPDTGEIVATTHPINSSINAKKEETIDICSDSQNLRKSHIRGKRECNVLRKRLVQLRDHHKHESNEIDRLQEKLDDKVAVTWSDNNKNKTSISGETDKVGLKKMVKVKDNVEEMIANEPGGCPRAKSNNGVSKVPDEAGKLSAYEDTLTDEIVVGVKASSRIDPMDYMAYTER